MRPLSYSQIPLYLQCPLQYRLQYIDGLKPKFKWYFSFGTTIHRCAEYFFRVKVPPPPSLEKLLAFYQNDWCSQGYRSEKEESNYREFGQDILQRFWEIYSLSFKLPLAVEHHFSINIDGVKLGGFIDRMLDALTLGKIKKNRQPVPATAVEQAHFE